jgi:GAF domain-containing protein
VAHVPTAAGAGLPLTDELAAVFARMSGLLLNEDTVERALAVLSALAHETVAGSSGAGVTVIDPQGRRVTSGATDQRVSAADRLQYDLDDGPCLEAAGTRRSIRADDLASETRWPRWSPIAVGSGLRAAMSAPLVAGERPLGAIKVYADDAGAFDDRGEQLLTLFAGQAAVLVANVQTAERAQRFSESLRDAFRSRDLVSMAKGVLMGRDGVGEDVAFRMLLARARDHGVAVRDEAQSVVSAAVRRRR